jgi:hypothetical protein
MEESLQTILGMIELLKSNQIIESTEMIDMERYIKLGDYCDSLVTVVANEYGIDKTNELIELANKRCVEELWIDE